MRKSLIFQDTISRSNKNQGFFKITFGKFNHLKTKLTFCTSYFVAFGWFRVSWFGSRNLVQPA